MLLFTQENIWIADLMQVANIKYIMEDSNEVYNLVKVIIVQNVQCKVKQIVNQQSQHYDNHTNINKIQYDEYISIFQDQINLTKSVADNIREVEILDFLKTQKVNFFKNLIYAFQKHILSCNDPKLVDLYESMTKDKWTLQHIQQRITKNLKDCNRYGLKIKNLTSNENLNKIFMHFLKNAQDLWLKDSKIANTEQYLNFINLLIKANDLGILSKSIQYYNKSRR